MSSTEPVHSESETHPWSIQVPNHPVRSDSPEYVAARKKMNEIAAGHHDVVELQVLVRADRHRKLQRRRRHRPNNQPNRLVSVQLVVPHSASQTQ